MTMPMTKPSYRFHCSIVDEETGDIVIHDFCTPSPIGQFGACESVEIHVASMLRMFNRTVREEYEKKQWPHCDFCGEQVPEVFDYEGTKGCADCCTREQEADREANSQFGVGA